MRRMPVRFNIPAIADAEAIANLHVTCWREAYADVVPPDILANVDMTDRIERWPSCLAQSGNPTFLSEAEAEGEAERRSPSAS